MCNKCGGWLVAGADTYGPWIRCMSCGTYRDLLAPAPKDLALLSLETPGGNSGPFNGKMDKGEEKRQLPTSANHTKIERRINRESKPGGYKPDR